MNDPISSPVRRPGAPRIAILISGGGTNMVRLADALDARDGAGEVALVLSNVPGAGGLAKAQTRQIPTRTIDHRSFGRDRERFEAELAGALDAANIDIVCLAGFMRILTGAFVARYEGRMLNIHPSLLPLYRGLQTHERALAAGDAEHGCTVHLVTAELDDGPILGQGRVPILAGDTPDTLATRVQAMEHRLYPEVLLRFLNGVRDPLHLS